MINSFNHRLITILCSNTVFLLPEALGVQRRYRAEARIKSLTVDFPYQLHRPDIITISVKGVLNVTKCLRSTLVYTVLAARQVQIGNITQCGRSQVFSTVTEYSSLNSVMFSERFFLRLYKHHLHISFAMAFPHCYSLSRGMARQELHTTVRDRYRP